MADAETIRRIRAAIAYADVDQTEIARGLDISTRTLERWKVQGVPRPRINLPLLATECGLPAAFFYANFDRLGEITEPQDAARPDRRPPLPQSHRNAARRPDSEAS